MLPPPLPTFQTGHVVNHTTSGTGVARPSQPMVNVTPLIHLSGFAPQAPPGASSSMRTIAAGYTPNHLAYNATRQYLASNAYALQAGHVIIVEVRAVNMPMGRTRALLIGVSATGSHCYALQVDSFFHKDVLQAVDNIPIHIGAIELKAILYDQILPLWSAYTEGFPLKMDNVIMRNKEWVEICPLNPDHNVISRPFFKYGKNGTSTFKTSQCIINFHIPNTVYNRYLDYADKKEEQRQVKAAEVCTDYSVTVLNYTLHLIITDKHSYLDGSRP